MYIWIIFILIFVVILDIVLKIIYEHKSTCNMYEYEKYYECDKCHSYISKIYGMTLYCPGCGRKVCNSLNVKR